MNISEIKNICNQLEIRPTKKLGQNFLINPHFVEKIISASELKPNDTVLEIGPGLGVLTCKLVEQAGRVVAVEADKKIAEYLMTNNQQLTTNNKIEIINADILKIKNSDLFKNLKIKNYKIISNLPYNITSQVLWKFLHEEKNKPTEMIIMLQKEVGERILSKPGKMSILSVLCQFYAEITKVCDVSRGNFWPEPEVDSVVLKLKLKKQNSKVKNEKEFFRIVKFGFAQKRKMLKNNLSNALQNSSPKTSSRDTAEKIISTLKNIGLNEKVRAQELSVENWIEICNEISN